MAKTSTIIRALTGWTLPGLAAASCCPVLHPCGALVIMGGTRIQTSARPPAILAVSHAAALEALIDGATTTGSAVNLKDGTRVDLPVSPEVALPPLRPATDGGTIIGRAAIEAAIRLLPAVSTDETRTGLNGVHFGPTAVAATDGHRLMVERIEGPDRGIIVHRRLIAALQKDGAGELVILADGRIFVSGATWWTTAAADCGDFPDYGQVIPKASSTAISLDPADLPKVGGKGSPRAVLFDLAADDRIAWSFKGDDDRAADGSFSADVRGPRMVTGRGSFEKGTPTAKIGFNPRYLREAAAFVATAGAVICIGIGESPLDPVVVVGADPSRLAVVMPMRLE